MGRNSRKEPGQPWKRARGVALGRVERRAVKWIVKVWEVCGSVIVVWKLGKVFTWDSVARLEDVRMSGFDVGFGGDVPVEIFCPSFLCVEHPVSSNAEVVFPPLVLVTIFCDGT